MSYLYLNDAEEIVLHAECSGCGKEEDYTLNEKEADTLAEYEIRGREMGYIQELFPKIPAWIRSACIDIGSNGFCLCPDCNPFA